MPVYTMHKNRFNNSIYLFSSVFKCSSRRPSGVVYILLSCALRVFFLPSGRKKESIIYNIYLCEVSHWPVAVGWKQTKPFVPILTIAVLNNISSVLSHNRRHFNSNGLEIMSHQVRHGVVYNFFFVFYSLDDYCSLLHKGRTSADCFPPCFLLDVCYRYSDTRQTVLWNSRRP